MGMGRLMMLEMPLIAILGSTVHGVDVRWARGFGNHFRAPLATFQVCGVPGARGQSTCYCTGLVHFVALVSCQDG